MRPQLQEEEDFLAVRRPVQLRQALCSELVPVVQLRARPSGVQAVARTCSESRTNKQLVVDSPLGLQLAPALLPVVSLALLNRYRRLARPPPAHLQHLSFQRLADLQIYQPLLNLPRTLLVGLLAGESYLVTKRTQKMSTPHLQANSLCCCSPIQLLLLDLHRLQVWALALAPYSASTSRRVSRMLHPTISSEGLQKVQETLRPTTLRRLPHSSRHQVAPPPAGILHRPLRLLPNPPMSLVHRPNRPMVELVLLA